MGETLKYSIESGILLLLLFLVYRLWISGRASTRTSRFFIIVSYLAAAVFPLLLSLDFSLRQQTVAVDFGPLKSYAVNGGNMAERIPLWPAAAVVTYISGALFVFVRTAIVWIRLTFFIRRARLTKLRGANVAVTDCGPVAPFCWLNNIVISTEDIDEDMHLVLRHELYHIRSLHCIDLIIAQLFIIFNWFNPAAWLMRNELKDIHEYEVDSDMIATETAVGRYQMMLIRKAVGKSFPALTDSLNHSKLYKRITMMKKSKNLKRRAWRVAIAVPAIGIAVFTLRIPAVAKSLDTLGAAELPGKFTKNPATAQVSEASVPALASAVAPAAKNAVAETEATNIQEVLENASAAGNVTFGDMKYYLDGKLITSEELKKLDPASIGSISIDKSVTPPVIRISSDKAEKVYSCVEVPASFPGGQKAMIQWLIENIRFPQELKGKLGKRVRVIVRFTVGADGKISDPVIIRGGEKALEEEAIRVVSAMPEWIPGEISGEKVASSFALPVVFDETEKETK